MSVLLMLLATCVCTVPSLSVGGNFVILTKLLNCISLITRVCMYTNCWHIFYSLDHQMNPIYAQTYQPANLNYRHILSLFVIEKNTI